MNTFDQLLFSLHSDSQKVNLTSRFVVTSVQSHLSTEWQRKCDRGALITICTDGWSAQADANYRCVNTDWRVHVVSDHATTAVSVQRVSSLFTLLPSQLYL